MLSLAARGPAGLSDTTRLLPVAEAPWTPSSVAGLVADTGVSVVDSGALAVIACARQRWRGAVQRQS
jgi:hypothetical protein